MVIFFLEKSGAEVLCPVLPALCFVFLSDGVEEVTDDSFRGSGGGSSIPSCGRGDSDSTSDT